MGQLKPSYLVKNLKVHRDRTLHMLQNCLEVGSIKTKAYCHLVSEVLKPLENIFTQSLEDYTTTLKQRNINIEQGIGYGPVF